MTRDEINMKLTEGFFTFIVIMAAIIGLIVYFNSSTMAGDMAQCGDQPRPDVYTGSGNPNIVMPAEQYKTLVDGWTTCKVAVVKKWDTKLDKATTP